MFTNRATNCRRNKSGNIYVPAAFVLDFIAFSVSAVTWCRPISYSICPILQHWRYLLNHIVAREIWSRAKANVINPSQTFQLSTSLSRCQISRNIFRLSFNSNGVDCKLCHLIWYNFKYFFIHFELNKFKKKQKFVNKSWTNLEQNFRTYPSHIK